MKNVLMLGFLLILSVSGVQAQSITKVGTSAANFLKIPVGARGAGMGGAVTALVNDPSSMFWNPAGLAAMNRSGVMMEHTDWFIDVNHNFLGLTMPVGSGVLGFNVVALTMDDMIETTYDFQEGTGRTFGAYSLAVGVSYAQYLLTNFSMGGSFKFVREAIMNSAASSFIFDVGTIYVTPFWDVKLGVSITNIGGKMSMFGDDLIISYDPIPNERGEYRPDAKLATDAFDLPIMLRVGLAWDAIRKEHLRVTVATDVNSPSDNVQSLSVGTEVALLNELLILRAGLPQMGKRDRVETFNAGIGLNYTLNPQLGLRFGYAYQGYEYLGGVNRVSLGLIF